MSLAQLQSIQFLPGTTALDYSDELNVLGITGDKFLWLLSDPLNSTERGNCVVISQHGHPSLVRFNPGGSPQPCILLADLCGPIDVYDTESLHLQRSYLEHCDKVTGIDWISRDSHSFISCSKDGTVKLYDLLKPHSYTSLSLNMNVCGVRCNPFNMNQFAFGTSEGKFFVYDIRQMISPYLEVKGHSRTVSRVIFISSDEILSMSLDSTAKLWDINRTVCINNYVGHVHHTYFVGVDAIEDYIVMGGEDSSLRVYGKRDRNCITHKRISSNQVFVCGCVWLNSSSSNVQKYLLALDNEGQLALLRMTI